MDFYCEECNLEFEGFTELWEHAIFNHEQIGETTTVRLRVSNKKHINETKPAIN